MLGMCRCLRECSMAPGDATGRPSLLCPTQRSTSVRTGLPGRVFTAGTIRAVERVYRSIRRVPGRRSGLPLEIPGYAVPCAALQQLYPDPDTAVRAHVNAEQCFPVRQIVGGWRGNRYPVDGILKHMGQVLVCG